MRRLAAAVGAEAMSLYNHVDGKDAVLDGLTGVFLERIELPPPTDDWQHDVRALAAAFRAAARRHPHTASLALTREAVSDQGVALTAAALDALDRAGFAPEDAVDALRTVTALLVGTLLRELSAPGVSSRSGAGDAEAREALLRASGFPAIEAAAAPLARFDFDREFDYGLELVLAALAVRRATRAR